MMFMISSASEIYDAPKSLIFTCLMFFIGFIVHITIYHKDIKFSKYGMGLYILAIGVAFGGCNRAILATEQGPFYVLVGCLVSIFMIMFLASVQSIDSNRLANYMLDLSLLIIFELLITTGINLLDHNLNFEMFNLYWGSNDAISAILLLTMPFAIYKGIKEKKYIYYIYYVVLFITLSLMGNLTAIIVSLATTLLATILLSIKLYEIIKPVLLFISFLFIISLITLGFYLINKEQFLNYFNTLSFNLINKKRLYLEAFDIYKSNPLFGIGLADTFNWQVESSNGLEFAYNTFLEMLVIGGTFGLITLLYHLLDKYSRVLYRFNLEKCIIFLAYISTGIYGLFDKTYFLPSFSLILVILMVSTDNIIKDRPKWLINTIWS